MTAESKRNADSAAAATASSTSLFLGLLLFSRILMVLIRSWLRFIFPVRRSCVVFLLSLSLYNVKQRHEFTLKTAMSSPLSIFCHKTNLVFFILFLLLPKRCTIRLADAACFGIRLKSVCIYLCCGDCRCLSLPAISISISRLAAQATAYHFCGFANSYCAIAGDGKSIITFNECRRRRRPSSIYSYER